MGLVLFVCAEAVSCLGVASLLLLKHMRLFTALTDTREISREIYLKWSNVSKSSYFERSDHSISVACAWASPQLLLHIQAPVTSFMMMTFTDKEIQIQSESSGLQPAYLHYWYDISACVCVCLSFTSISIVGCAERWTQPYCSGSCNDSNQRHFK